jgi:hypothetical protein
MGWGALGFKGARGFLRRQKKRACRGRGRLEMTFLQEVEVRTLDLELQAKG